MQIALTVKNLSDALKSVKPATAVGYDHLDEIESQSRYARKQVKTAHEHFHLDHVMLIARDNQTVTLYTENADRCMFVTIPATVQQPGAYAIQLKRFAEWVNLCVPSEAITISHPGDKVSFGKESSGMPTAPEEYVTVCYGRNRARFVGRNIEESIIGPGQLLTAPVIVCSYDVDAPVSKPRYRVPLAVMQAACGVAPASVEAAPAHEPMWLDGDALVINPAFVASVNAYRAAHPEDTRFAPLAVEMQSATVAQLTETIADEVDDEIDGLIDSIIGYDIAAG
jgi:hypothetical protein